MQPLAGLSILEVNGDVAVRYCGRLFSKLGASVTRIGGVCGDARIGYAEETGKAFGAWLDEGKRFAASRCEIPQRCDLVIGGQDQAGIKAAEDVARTIGAPFLAIGWFDRSGPYGEWEATDEIISALNGVSYAFGEAEGPPMLAQGHAPQVTAGLVAFIAGLAQLLVRAERRARRIDVNVLEASLCFCETAALTGGTIRLGINRYVPTYPCSAYRSADGWVGITCLTPAQWTALCRAIGKPDLGRDVRFATAYERLLLSDEVDAILSPEIARRTTGEWVALAKDNRIPIAPMVRPGLLPEVAHWQERGAFTRTAGTNVLAPTLPYRLTFDRERTAPNWNDEDTLRPLTGLRVLDFSMGWSGPLCSRTLGDLGADVVKVESESHPDWWRGWEAGSVDATTRENKLNFVAVNRNKRGIDLDLTSAGDVECVKRLIGSADVVMDNYAAGVIDKLGLGHDVQRQIKPAVISLSMPAFGSGGPLSALRAYGSTVEQASGLPFVNGEDHWLPAQQHIAFGDPIAGLYAASAIIAALYARETMGGAAIDLSQVACLFQIGADAIIAEQLLDRPVERSGHSRARLHLCTVLRAAADDSWLAVAIRDEEEFDRLAAIAGGRERTDLERWASRISAHEAAAILQAAKIAAAPIQSPTDLTQDEHLLATGYWLPMTRAFVGDHVVGAAPFRFDGVCPEPTRTAPLLGEHMREIEAELGLGDA